MESIKKFVDHVFHKDKHEWSYEGECGPQTWSEKFAGAAGKHQSPINIDTSLAQFDSRLNLNPLKINYDDDSCFQIKNTGHTFQVDGFKMNKSSKKVYYIMIFGTEKFKFGNLIKAVSGGPVQNEYNFLQFHMHWGDFLDKGSEHLIDNRPYSAELHFVNWNHELYTDPKFASSSSKNDGLLVLAVFIKVGEHNQEFEKIIQYINDIHLKDHHHEVSNINMRNLMPDNINDYWTYPGSLTTPPCSECVTWIVFRDNIEISKEQLDKCHYLYCAKKEKQCSEKTLIKYNDRPVCSMGDRIVSKSFE